MRRSPKLAVILMALGGASLAVAGCTTSPASKSTGSTSPRTTVITTYPNTVKLHPQAAITSCQAASGGWAASGTIHNTGTASHDYKLTVYFTNSKATVLSSGQTSEKVAAGKTGHWSVTVQFAAPSTVRCVLVGVA